GWHDIQSGYTAGAYRLFFDLQAVTLPAWSAGRSFAPQDKTELVLSLGLARLFSQDGDAERLSEIIANHFNLSDALGASVTAGCKILQSILEPELPFSAADLLQDRKQCCQKRDAWPRRPTEILPFGVLDIELMLRFPKEASFAY